MPVEAWQKRVTKIKAYQHMTGLTRFDDPEERELAESFDKEFTELFKVVPKSNRKALLNMLPVIYELTCFESYKGYFIGQGSPSAK